MTANPNKDASHAPDLEHTNKLAIKPPSSNATLSKEIGGAESDDADEEDQRRYRVERVSAHRWSETSGVELLVHWGDEYSHDPPTWEPEDILWQDCRNAVLAYWTPNGLNTRTKRLGLDKYKGPFVIAQILKKKVVDNQAYYRVEWVGYGASTWEPIGSLPSEIVNA